MPRKPCPFVCAVAGCDFSTDVQAILLVHVRRTHTGSKGATCPVCSFASWDSDAFKAHKRTHRGEAVHACAEPGCSYRAWTPGGLRGHLLTHSTRRGMRRGTLYQCLVAGCGFIAAAYSKLEAHSRVHTDNKHFCDVPGCTFGCKEPSALTVHTTRAHKGQRPHVCAVPGCSFAGAVSSQLWRHMRKHTEEEMSLLYEAGRRR